MQPSGIHGEWIVFRDLGAPQNDRDPHILVGPLVHPLTPKDLERQAVRALQTHAFAGKRDDELHEVIEVDFVEDVISRSVEESKAGFHDRRRHTQTARPAPARRKRADPPNESWARTVRFNRAFSLEPRC
jgi:hypothetical protein